VRAERAWLASWRHAAARLTAGLALAVSVGVGVESGAGEARAQPQSQPQPQPQSQSQSQSQLSRPIVIEDARGKVVTFDRVPLRVVSLVPSLTESVCHLGACERLVGVDRSSNHPMSVQSLPKLGGIDDANVEAIVALRPDVVLAGDSSRVLARLEGFGLRVIALEPRTQAAAKQAYAKLGELLAVDDADSRWAAVERDAAAAAASVSTLARGWRVYIEVGSGPYAAGAASFMGELLASMALPNIVPSALGPFPKLDPEFIVRANPALIVTASTSVQALRARPGWHRVEAVDKGRICILRGDDADAFSRPGPRLPQAARAVVDCIARWVP
jgi:iron complex transport system substrate-binding protein